MNDEIEQSESLLQKIINLIPLHEQAENLHVQKSISQ